jgi:hypothetical protein
MPLLLSSARIGRWQLVTRPSRTPPFFRQFFLPSLLADRFRLGFSPRLCDGSILFGRSCLATQLEWPRRRRGSRRQVARKPQLGGWANRGCWSGPDGPDHGRGTEADNLRRNRKSDRVGQAHFFEFDHFNRVGFGFE